MCIVLPTEILWAIGHDFLNISLGGCGGDNWGLLILYLASTRQTHTTNKQHSQFVVWNLVNRARPLYVFHGKEKIGSRPVVIVKGKWVFFSYQYLSSISSILRRLSLKKFNVPFNFHVRRSYGFLLFQAFVRYYFGEFIRIGKADALKPEVQATLTVFAYQHVHLVSFFAVMVRVESTRAM